MDTNKLWELIGDARLWGLCAVAFTLGGVGGFIQSVVSLPSAEDFKRDWWKRVLIGAIAAVAVIYITNPDDATEFIGGSLVAGYAGQAILGALETRAKLAATREVAATERKLAVQSHEVEQVTRERDAAAEAADLLMRETPGAPSASAAGGDTAMPAHVERAARLLRSVRRAAPAAASPS